MTMLNSDQDRQRAYRALCKLTSRWESSKNTPFYSTLCQSLFDMDSSQVKKLFRCFVIYVDFIHHISSFFCPPNTEYILVFQTKYRYVTYLYKYTHFSFSVASSLWGTVLNFRTHWDIFFRCLSRLGRILYITYYSRSQSDTKKNYNRVILQHQLY